MCDLCLEHSTPVAEVCRCADCLCFSDTGEHMAGLSCMSAQLHVSFDDCLGMGREASVNGGLCVEDSDCMYECSCLLLHTRDFPGLHVNMTSQICVELRLLFNCLWVSVCDCKKCVCV